jgi:murein DD-endopeptidase MepM/ murein hydrolase activator NlpD
VPFAGDPVAPVQPPTRFDPDTRYYTETGHYLGGGFLAYYKTTPNALVRFGLPLSEEFAQKLPNGGVYRVQYFERARLEAHPELPASQRVQLGVLAPALLQGRSFDRLPALPSTASRLYFPETGHTISNGFLYYWKTNGGIAQFGFPLSEEMGEKGLTVQYFERARFEYYPGLEGTGYAVQLSPIGYYALNEAGYTTPAGTLVRINPPRLAEGHTAVVEVAASEGVTITGHYQGRALLFKQDPARGVAWAMLGSVPFNDLGTRPVSMSVESNNGSRRTVTRTLETVAYKFPSESLTFDPETTKLLDPALTTKETNTLNAIFSGRTTEKQWDSTFRMPLDGKIRVTSIFATRRCYSCPVGGKPTSYHGGMDMAAAEGTPVHAPAAGTIVLSEKLAVRGNVIIIDHGMGVFTLLAHNSKLIAQVGQTVQKGEVVSLSGNTGLSNGPHLHWEVHVSGPPVDPLEWVNRVMP